MKELGAFGPKQLRMTPPPEPDAGSGITLSSVAGLVTAGVAIFGALWFGLLSYGAAIAYEPAGVRLREIGLGSGTVLSQAAVGVAIWGVIAVPIGALYVLWARVSLRARGIKPGKWAVLGALGLVLFAVVAATVGNVLGNAYRARDGLRKGERAEDARLTFGIRNPWGGEIARIDWAEVPPAGAPALPRCALYLGEAGGTAVFYSEADKRTWRLPSSALIVRARPDRKSC